MHGLIFLLVVGVLGLEEVLVVMTHDAFFEEIQSLLFDFLCYVIKCEIFCLHEVLEACVAVLDDFGDAIDGSV